ncbi:hypothetical protein GCM10027162_06350 [Streptomyces incanus]
MSTPRRAATSPPALRQQAGRSLCRTGEQPVIRRKAGVLITSTSSGGRPETVAPNTTSSRPVDRAGSTVHKPCTAVLSVSPDRRAHSYGGLMRNRQRRLVRVFALPAPRVRGLTPAAPETEAMPGGNGAVPSTSPCGRSPP